jgi:hypothetical protein
MDTYQFLVLLHVIGTILGTGGATIAELQITRALRDKQVSLDERALMHVNYGMIRVGMGILLVSVIGMFWYFALQGSEALFTSEKLWIKELMFVVIFLNAIAIQRRWVPLWLGASTSFTSWWGATLLGLAGELPYSFTTYLIGYVLAIFAVAGVLHGLRDAGERGWLAGRRLTLAIVSLIAALLFIVIMLVYSEQAARTVQQEITSTAPAADIRTLRETVFFEYPGGSHTIAFVVTLDAAQTITNIEGADIDPANQGRIADFVSEVSTIVVGQPLADLTPLARVGGASLTTTAFNEAIANMQQQEK